MTNRCLIDLHLHLDGSLSLASARHLAILEGVELPASDDQLHEALSCPPDCRDLNDYLSRFDLPGRLMQTAQAVEDATRTLCDELVDDGLIYAEIRFAPQLHCTRGLTQDQVVEAALRGLHSSALDANLILCCMRGEPERVGPANLETIHVAHERMGAGVCACDLAGAEALFGNELFVGLFDEAHRLGIPLTVHAGEAAGANSVRLAVEHGAARIGHGVRSIEDPSVVELLRTRGVALEVCPTSNLNTRVFSSISEMPIMRLIEQGVDVTINSDNMAVSNTNVGRELGLVGSAFSLAPTQVRALLLSSAQAAFIDDAHKARLRARIERDFATA